MNYRGWKVQYSTILGKPVWLNSVFRTSSNQKNASFRLAACRRCADAASASKYCSEQGEKKEHSLSYGTDTASVSSPVGFGHRRPYLGTKAGGVSNEVHNNICRSQTIERLSDRLLEDQNPNRLLLHAFQVFIKIAIG
jgi:hypothetical protein